MDLRPPVVRELLAELEKLPGVGPRTATRLIQHLLDLPEGGRPLAEALLRAGERVKRCEICFLFAEETPCPVCADHDRDRSLVCVVEDALNAWAVEATGEFRGIYHVLLGALDPLHGIGPDELTTRQLVDRVQGGTVHEVILATNPTVEGEATAHYLARQLRPTGVTITRIAFGLPAGGEISYADQVTLTRSITGRRGMD